MKDAAVGCFQLKFHFILPFVPGSLNSLLKIQKFSINFALELEFDEKHLKYFRVPEIDEKYTVVWILHIEFTE